MYVMIENGTVIKVCLPKKGTLKDGRAVSNYHILPQEILLEEGWLPLVREAVNYDQETHFINGYQFEIHEDMVIERPVIVEKPIDVPDAPTELTPEERIAELERLVQELLAEREA